VSPGEFKQLFDDCYRPLCHFANGLVNDPDIAEDVVQEVFIQLWKKDLQVNEHLNIKSLLFTAVRNKSLDYLRQRNVQQKHYENIRWITPSEEQYVSREEVDKFMLIDKIYISIRQLPPKCGEVFTLCKVNGLSYAQISEQLNISVKTVENHMQKAFRLLRQILADSE